MPHTGKGSTRLVVEVEVKPEGEEGEVVARVACDALKEVGEAPAVLVGRLAQLLARSRARTQRRSDACA